MKKVFAIALVLGLLLGLYSQASALQMTTHAGTIYNDGLTVTGVLLVESDCTCSLIGGTISIQEKLPGGSWTTKGWLVDYSTGAFSHGFAYSVLGVPEAQYRLINTYVVSIEGGESISLEVDEGTITIPPPPQLDHVSRSVTPNGSFVSGSARVYSVGTVDRISGTVYLQSSASGSMWATRASKNFTGFDVSDAGASLSCSGTLDYYYRTKVEWVIENDSQVITGTSYSSARLN